MYQYLEYLNNPFIAGFFAAILVIAFAYIDKQINDRDFTYKYYVRLFLMVFFTVSVLVYVIKTNKVSSKHLGGGDGTSSLANHVEEPVRAIVEKIGRTGGSSSSSVNRSRVFADIPDF